MRRALMVIAAGLTLFLASTGVAQTGAGRLSGLVKDATGALAPGVTVTALHEETGVRHETVTTDNGLFLFPSLPVGPYTLRAELSGFKTVSRPGIVLTVGTDINLTINMEPGGLEETVTVRSESPLVQTTESSLSTLVARETIVTLPLNGRNPLHLIGLVPVSYTHLTLPTIYSV